jgi:hypothetical protein
MGGLGNWLFQASAGVKFAQDLGIQYCLAKETARLSPHSSVDYFSIVFSKFSQRDKFRGNGAVWVNEPPNFNHTDYRGIIRASSSGKDIDVILVGYFQHYEFVPRTFKEMLTLPAVDSVRVRDTCFIHIRGGDYVNHPLHDVKLAKYYQRCIEKVQNEYGIKKFSIFTNDKPYALRQEFMKNIDYEFVDANELESLVLMSECKAGICANSSFSWWGAYFNRDRLICMPSKWFNDPNINISGYYFPGVSVVEV